MDYVIAQLVLLAAAVSASLWLHRRLRWRAEQDRWADESVDYFRWVKNMPETPQIVRDLNVGLAHVERAQMTFGGVPVVTSEFVEDHTALYIGRKLGYTTEQILVMKPSAIAMITGLD